MRALEHLHRMYLSKIKEIRYPGPKFYPGSDDLR